MNENIDLTKILKDCPIGWKLYTPLYGEVEFKEICVSFRYAINTSAIDTSYGHRLLSFTKEGFYYDVEGTECLLFPSAEQRDWSKFTAPWYKKEKFDPKTLQPFDKVLVRDNDSENWMIQLFSHIIEGEVDYPYSCIINPYRYCIPCDGNTKHLLGTNEEAPEYYRYWED